MPVGICSTMQQLAPFRRNYRRNCSVQVDWHGGVHRRFRAHRNISSGKHCIFALDLLLCVRSSSYFLVANEWNESFWKRSVVTWHGTKQKWRSKKIKTKTKNPSGADCTQNTSNCVGAKPAFVDMVYLWLIGNCFLLLFGYYFSCNQTPIPPIYPSVRCHHGPRTLRALDVNVPDVYVMLYRFERIHFNLQAVKM